MPLISQFYGIVITMYFDEKCKHKKPHFHAKYGEYKASYDLTGERLAGELPPKQHKLVVAWAEIHREELIALWKTIKETGEYFVIKGLE